MGFLELFSRQRPPVEFLEGRVGYAVGDIHGRADLLERLFCELEGRADADARPAGPPIVVFLGDYVDRGPKSAAVVDLLLTGRPTGLERRYLKGNHEESMLGFMQAPLENRAWVLQGGAETLSSYGVTPPPPVGATEADWLDASARLNERVPAAHKAFLEGLERYVVLGGYAFVHAGINGGRSLEKQTDADLFWSRQQFLNDRRRFSHRVVHGHTPVDQPYMDARRIAVDTGAYATGVLSAARFEGAEVSFLSVNASGLTAKS